MPKLFEDDVSDTDVDIKTNNDYATKYNTWREKEELYKLKTKYGDHATLNLDRSEDESSSSEDDEDGKHLTEEFEKDFFKTLARLKRKDPKIYDNKVVFFEKKLGENDTQEKKSKKQEPMFIKDYERKMILEKGAKFEDSDEEELEEDPRSSSPTYVEEQRKIKESLKTAFDDQDEDDEKWGGLFEKRNKSKAEQEKEEEDYKKWLKGNKEHLANEEMETELKSLKEYWNNPDLDKEEEFLRDYLLNKRYLEKEDENHVPTYEEIIHDSDDNLSEDEKNIDKQEEFEHKYNFRFEEPDQDFIKRYPRTMDHSVRKTDDRRKLKRVEIKERKEEEKKQKQVELKQLKIFKRKEIEEKIKKIKEITGNEDMAFQEMDIDGDFDPEEHDRRMQELFNDEYYNGDENDQKPEFSDLEEELGQWKDHNELHCEDDDFNMDCDYDPSTSKKEKKEKKKRNRSGKTSKNKEVDELPLDENDERYGEYMDELYKLDCEDMIGDIPCRFKYREVVPNDFGLSIEEILLAKDKELNRWCSLKKTTQYRPEQAERYDVIAYKRKATNETLKQKYLPSMYEELEQLDEHEDKKNTKVFLDNKQNENNKYIEDEQNEENENLENDNLNNKQKETEHLENENNDNNVTETKKSKKKRKYSEMVENEVNEKKKSKKKRTNTDLSEVHENENNDNEVNETNMKKKSKKKHNNTENTEIRENENNDNKVNETTNTPRKLSRRQKRNRKLNKEKPHDNVQEESSKNKSKKTKVSDDNANNSPKRQIFKHKNKKKGTDNKHTQISDSRLLAYGINPKKYKNKLKYKPKAQ